MVAVAIGLATDVSGFDVLSWVKGLEIRDSKFTQPSSHIEDGGEAGKGGCMLWDGCVELHPDLLNVCGGYGLVLLAL